MSEAIAIPLTATEIRELPRFLEEEIRVPQRQRIIAYIKRHPSATHAEIADALDLALWTLACRLAEIAGDPRPYAKPQPAKVKRNRFNPYPITKAKS